MKALILVGGYGTRLRPLTLSVPKPLIQFCNKSIVEHQVEALVRAGVTEVILAVAYQPEAMLAALKDLEAKFNVRIYCSREEEPLGTAGPIQLAKDLLITPCSNSDSFFVLNSDVICAFPLEEMLKFHKEHGAEGTILATRVSDPSKYGVIVSKEDGCITGFHEKPTQFVGDFINAGLYILRNTVIDRIELRPTSIEKEIFPQLAANNQLYCLKHDGYWADIGQPSDFLRGMELYLASSAEKDINNLSPTLALQGPGIIGNVMMDSTAEIGLGCVIGPNVTIGPKCRIGAGVRIQNSAVMEGVQIMSHSWVNRTIIGWNSTIGQWVRIEGLSVVGLDVQIKAECYVNASFVLPHKIITSSIHTEGTIVM